MTEDQIRELAAILGKRPKRSGENIMFSCPAATVSHRNGIDRKASFGIKIEPGVEESICNCFTCGLVGSARYVFQKLGRQGVVPQEAVDFVVEVDTVSLEDIFAGRVERRSSGREVANVCQSQQDPLQKFVTKCRLNRGGDDYLFSRGLTGDEIRLYDLGFDADSGRVVIPFADSSGKVRGCQGRAIDPTVEPKYYNYDQKFNVKCEVLFGEKFLQPAHELVLVEGPFDVIFVRRMLPAVLALRGLNLSQPLLERILRFSRVVTLMFDGDYSGRSAVDILGGRISKRTRVFVVSLPDKMDPATLEPEVLLDLYQKKAIF